MENSGRMNGERPRTPPPSYSSTMNPPTHDFLVIPIPPWTADDSQPSSRSVDVPVFAVSYNRENRPEPLPVTGRSWLHRSGYNIPSEQTICGCNAQVCGVIIGLAVAGFTIVIVLITTLRLL